MTLHKNIRLTVTLALTLLIIALPRSGLAQGGGARVYISPATTTVNAGEQFTVEIVAEGITNLYAEEIHLRFDPQILAVLDADPQQEGIQAEAGSFLDPQHGFVVANKADNGEGTALFAMTLVNPAPPVQGGGVLARVSFQALHSGTADIQIEKVLLVNNSVQVIEASTAGAQAQIGSQAPAAPASTPGSATTAPPSTVLSNLLGPLLLVVIIAGLIVTGVFLRPYLRRPARQSGRRTARQRGLQQPIAQSGNAATLLKQARAALAKGDRTAAYYYYSQTAEIAPDNEQAWLGKAQTARSTAERRLCLMRLLTINPSNQEAQAELENLDKAKTRV